MVGTRIVLRIREIWFCFGNPHQFYSLQGGDQQYSLYSAAHVRKK